MSTPWICPACGCGNAPDTATCGQCIARQAFAPVSVPFVWPYQPFYPTQPWPEYPQPYIGDWPPWPGSGAVYVTIGDVPATSSTFTITSAAS